MQNISPSSVQNETPVQPTSLASRLMNVFVSPGEVFDEVKNSEYQMTNWLVPLVIVIITGVVYSMVVFSQPAILQKMKDSFEKSIQQQVDLGKTTRQQGDVALNKIEPFITPAIVGSAFGAGLVVFNMLIMLAMALVVWMLGTFLFNGVFNYGKALEVVGLSSIITVPGVIVTMCLAVIYGNVAMTPSPVLLIGAVDSHNRLHIFLSALNVFMLWHTAVTAIGLSRLSGATFWKCALWGYALWALVYVLPALASGGGPK